MLTRPTAGRRARSIATLSVRIGACAVLLAALSACRPLAPQPTPTATATATATVTPSPTATSTATPTVTPSPTATATPTPTFAPLPQAHLLEPMGHEYQGWNNCGVASAAMVLSYYGVARGQYDIAAIVRPHRDDRHVGTAELLAYLESEGLQGRVCVNGDVERLQSFIAAGIPVLIRTWLEPGEDIGHYVVVRGYDRAAGVLIANDSYFGPGIEISEEELEQIWPGFHRTYIPVYRPTQADLVCRILGDDCEEEAMYRRAAEAARQWTQEAPDDPYAWFCLGDSLLALGEPESALEAYAQAEAVGLPPRMFWYHFGPYEARLAAGLYEELLESSAQVLADLPAIEELHLLRGQAYEALGSEEQAVAEYRLAFEYHTNWAPAVAALERLGAPLPPVPTATPFGTPSFPSNVKPTPAPSQPTP